MRETEKRLLDSKREMEQRGEGDRDGAEKTDGDIDGQSRTVNGGGQGVGREPQKDSDKESGQRNGEEASGKKLMHSETCAPGDR